MDSSDIAQRVIRQKHADQLSQWKARNHPLPIPHAYKSARVRAVAQQFGCKVLVETGTWVGDMIHAVRHDFRHIHSIELSPYFAERARYRFANHPHICIHEGDSGTLLPQLLTSLHERGVLWLDAHYSGGLTAHGVETTPIAQELATARGRGHCILIDDAHCFLGRDSYPTVDELRALTSRDFPDYRFTVTHDIIELLPG